MHQASNSEDSIKRPAFFSDFKISKSISAAEPAENASTWRQSNVIAQKKKNFKYKKTAEAVRLSFNVDAAAVYDLGRPDASHHVSLALYGHFLQND